METLYIIGNGFDIHHGINSSFEDYRKWLHKKAPYLYDKLHTFYNIEDDKWWSDFEQNLAEISSDYINELYVNYSPVYGSDDFRDADNHSGSIQAGLDVENLISDIRFTFSTWVQNLNRPNKGKIRIENLNSAA